MTVQCSSLIFVSFILYENAKQDLVGKLFQGFFFKRPNYGGLANYGRAKETLKGLSHEMGLAFDDMYTVISFRPE
jgi:hypothetical protein